MERLLKTIDTIVYRQNAFDEYIQEPSERYEDYRKYKVYMGDWTTNHPYFGHILPFSPYPGLYKSFNSLKK